MDIQTTQTLIKMENEQHDENKPKEKKKSVLKNIIGWIVYLGLLAGLIFGTPKALSYVLDTSYPMAAITSGSMWPALEKGDMVFIKGIKSREEVDVGDIVVYQNPQGFTIHRVVELQAARLVTKGDANNISDTPVSYQDVIGKTVEFQEKPFRIPLLGNVSILLNKR
ncbi:MAG: signal peptidase I [Patescibacteria group bacterium]